MSSRLSISIVFFHLFLASAAFGQSPEPPVAKKEPISETIFGETIAEDYRYMENLKDPYVVDWFKGQSDATRAALDAIPARKALLDRIVELDSARTVQVLLPRIANGKYFYRRRAATENIFKIYVREDLQGEERMLIDPDAKNPPEGQHNAVDYFTPSQDASLVAYGLSAGGSEESVLHVTRTADGLDLPDAIDRALFGYISWLPDGQSFFYNRLQKLAPDAPVTDKYRNSRAYLHKLGDDPDQDKPMLGVGLSPAVEVKPEDIPYIDLSSGSKYVFAVVDHGVLREITVYFATLAEVQGAPDAASIPWKPICDVADGITSYDLHGDHLYLLSHKNASRFKVLRMDLTQPDLASAVEIVPQGEGVVTGIRSAGDGLYVVVREGGVKRLRRIPHGGDRIEEIKLPLEGNVYVSTDPVADGALLSLGGWTQAPLIYACDPASGSVTDTGMQPKGLFDAPEDLVSEQVFATAPDGTKIPLSIVYRKGLRRDGSNPAWINGYGSYGFSAEPYYSATRLAWTERGGVMAFAHVRGGGEYGDDWHRAGQKTTKPNTWRDFIACAEYLIENKYTSSEKLAGSGTSAGGILIGRAITERPDLFGAACSDVGCSNVLRQEFGANGIPNIPEFGTIAIEEEFRALKEMDALSHVKDGEKYPAVLLTTGLNDPRVDSWQPAKMTARLQAASASGKPVLMRVDYNAGHGMGSTKMQRLELLADQMAFFLWQAGVAEFQP